MMKRMVLFVLAACMVFGVLSGCAGEAKPVEYDLDALSEALYQSGAFSDFLSPVSKDIAATFYGFADAEVTESVLLCSSMATTEEIGLFKCADEAAAEKLLAAAKTRAQTQSDIYASYAPAEPPKLEDAIIKREGNYVFYIVAVDYTKVQAVLSSQK